MVTGTAPAFAMVLPDGWQVSDGPAPLQATSATDDTLVLAVEPVPSEATFNDYVKRVEAALEKKAKTDLPTSYRQAGSGLIARIGTTPPDATPGTEPTTLFLFPTCADGVRTLTLTGTAEPAAEIGGLDSWDVIAAALNPCEASAPPTLVVDPVVHALAAPYLGFATDFGTRTNAAFQPLYKPAAVRVWNKQMTTLAAIEQDYIDGVSGLPWTPELQALVDPLMDEHRAIQAIEKKLSKAKTVKAINSLDDALTKAEVPTRASAAALRLAMGLSTAPQ
jgi:hypothetical protein